MSKWTIIYCSNYRGNFIHAQHLRKFNPDAQILALDFTNNYPTERIWKQCDLVIRPWLKENKHKIQHNNIAIVEYDVLMLQKLPDISLNNEMLVKRVLDPIEHSWWWFFSDKDQLGYLEPNACAINFFCFFAISKNCIDYWIDPKYDFLYEEHIDMQCELRVPTILKSNGVNIREGGDDLMYNIHCLVETGEDIEFDSNYPGFYHPVKNKWEGNINVQ